MEEEFDWAALQERYGDLPENALSESTIRDLGKSYDIFASGLGLESRPVQPEQRRASSTPPPELRKVLDWGDAWSGGLGDVLSDMVPIWSGVKELGEVKGLWEAAKRFEEGAPRPGDFDLLRQFMEEGAADKTVGYYIGSILRQLPAFAGEIWVGMGAARKAVAIPGMAALRESLEKSIHDAGTRAVARSFGKQSAALKASGDLVNAKVMRESADNLLSEMGEAGFMRGTRDAIKMGVASAAGAEAVTSVAGGITGAGWGGRSQTDAYRRVLSKAGIHMTADESGNLGIAFSDTLEDFTDQLPIAIANTLVEHVTERMGGELMAMPIMARVRGLQTAVASRFMKLNGMSSAKFVEYVQKVGWDGPVEEFMEERLGGIIRGVTFVGQDEWLLMEDEEGEYRLKTEEIFSDWRQYAGEFAAFMIPGVGARAMRGYFQGDVGPLEPQRKVRAGAEIETRLKRDTFERMIERRLPEGSLDILRTAKLNDPQYQRLYNEIRQDKNLREAATAAGIHGFRERAGTTEASEAVRWANTTPFRTEEDYEAGVVKPSTRYQHNLVDRFGHLFNIVFVQGNSRFDKEATSHWSDTTKGGANAKGTLYINAGMREDSGLGALNMLKKVFHEGTHQYDFMDEAHKEIALESIAESEEKMDAAGQRYKELWALHYDKTLRGEELEKAADEWFEKKFKPRYGDKWKEAFESEKRAILAEDHAEILEFLLVDDGAKHIDRLKAKKPRAIDHLRDWFIEKVNKHRSDESQIATGAEARMERIKNQLSGVAADRPSLEIARAFHSALSSLARSDVSGDDAGRTLPTSPMFGEEQDRIDREGQPETQTEEVEEDWSPEEVEDSERHARWWKKLVEDWSPEEAEEDTVQNLVDNNTRPQLNKLAEDAGIENPKRFPNKNAVAKAIFDAAKAGELEAMEAEAKIQDQGPSEDQGLSDEEYWDQVEQRRKEREAAISDDDLLDALGREEDRDRDREQEEAPMTAEEAPIPTTAIEQLRALLEFGDRVFAYETERIKAPRNERGPGWRETELGDEARRRFPTKDFRTKADKGVPTGAVRSGGAAIDSNWFVPSSSVRNAWAATLARLEAAAADQDAPAAKEEDAAEVAQEEGPTIVGKSPSARRHEARPEPLKKFILEWQRGTRKVDPQSFTNAEGETWVFHASKTFGYVKEPNGHIVLVESRVKQETIFEADGVQAVLDRFPTRASMNTKAISIGVQRPQSLSREELAEEILAIERAEGQSFEAPPFSLPDSDEYLDVLKKLGIEHGTSYQDSDFAEIGVPYEVDMPLSYDEDQALIHKGIMKAGRFISDHMDLEIMMRSGAGGAPQEHQPSMIFSRRQHWDPTSPVHAGHWRIVKSAAEFIMNNTREIVTDVDENLRRQAQSILDVADQFLAAVDEAQSMEAPPTIRMEPSEGPERRGTLQQLMERFREKAFDLISERQTSPDPFTGTKPPMSTPPEMSTEGSLRTTAELTGRLDALRASRDDLEDTLRRILLDRELATSGPEYREPRPDPSLSETRPDRGVPWTAETEEDAREYEDVNAGLLSLEQQIAEAEKALQKYQEDFTLPDRLTNLGGIESVVPVGMVDDFRVMGDLKMIEFNRNQIFSGDKVLTTRTASEVSNFYRGDGIYLLSDGRRVELTRSAEVEHTDDRVNDAYAIGEGYTSLADMKQRTLYSVKKWLRGESPGEMMTIFRVRPAESRKAARDEHTDGINISSYEGGLGGQLTNPAPTPVSFRGTQYPSAEAAYQATKGSQLDDASVLALMTEVITAKLDQHPHLRQEITDRGGANFLAGSTHNLVRGGKTIKTDRWTGKDGLFMRALQAAYEPTLADTPNRVRDKRRIERKLGAPEQGHPDAKVTTKAGEHIANGYTRIVYGDHGPYFEFTRDQLVRETFGELEQERVFYNEFYTDSRVKLYQQKKDVKTGGNLRRNPPKGKWSSSHNRPEGYADYVPGMFYVAADEVSSVGTGTDAGLRDSLGGKDLSGYVMHSGAAEGADTAFEMAAIDAGVTVKAHSFEGHAYGNKNRVEHSQEELEKADERLMKANESLGRQFPGKNNFINNLIRRNYFQVKGHNQIIAVARITGGEVEGGTAWAVQLGIDAGKNIHVFDMNTDGWFTWDGSAWAMSEAPVLEKEFAGIGSRFDLTPRARAEIKGLFLDKSVDVPLSDMWVAHRQNGELLSGPFRFPAEAGRAIEGKFIHAGEGLDFSPEREPMHGVPVDEETRREWEKSAQIVHQKSYTAHRAFASYEYTLSRRYDVWTDLYNELLPRLNKGEKAKYDEMKSAAKGALYSSMTGGPYKSGEGGRGVPTTGTGTEPGRFDEKIDYPVRDSKYLRYVKALNHERYVRETYHLPDSLRAEQWSYPRGVEVTPEMLAEREKRVLSWVRTGARLLAGESLEKVFTGKHGGRKAKDVKPDTIRKMKLVAGQSRENKRRSIWRKMNAKQRLDEARDALFGKAILSYELEGQVGVDDPGILVSKISGLPADIELRAHPMSGPKQFPLAPASRAVEPFESVPLEETGLESLQAAEDEVMLSLLDEEGTFSEQAMVQLLRAYKEKGGTMPRGRTLLEMELDKELTEAAPRYDQRIMEDITLLGGERVARDKLGQVITVEDDEGIEQPLMVSEKGRKVPMALPGPSADAGHLQYQLKGPTYDELGDLESEGDTREADWILNDMLSQSVKDAEDLRLYGYNEAHRRPNHAYEVAEKDKPKTASALYEKLEAGLEEAVQAIRGALQTYDEAVSLVLNMHMGEVGNDGKPWGWHRLGAKEGVPMPEKAAKITSRDRAIALHRHGDLVLPGQATENLSDEPLRLRDLKEAIDSAQITAAEIAASIRGHSKHQHNDEEGIERFLKDAPEARPVVEEALQSPWRYTYLVHGPEVRNMSEAGEVLSIFSEPGGLAMRTSSGRALTVPAEVVDELRDELAVDALMTDDITRLIDLGETTGVMRLSVQRAEQLKREGHTVRSLDMVRRSDFEPTPRRGGVVRGQRGSRRGARYATGPEGTDESIESEGQAIERQEEAVDNWLVNGPVSGSANANMQFFMRFPHKLDAHLAREYPPSSKYFPASTWKYHKERTKAHAHIWEMSRADRFAWYMAEQTKRDEEHAQYALAEWLGENIAEFGGRIGEDTLIQINHIVPQLYGQESTVVPGQVYREQLRNISQAISGKVPGSVLIHSTVPQVPTIASRGLSLRIIPPAELKRRTAWPNALRELSALSRKYGISIEGLQRLALLEPGRSAVGSKRAQGLEEAKLSASRAKARDLKEIELTRVREEYEAWQEVQERKAESRSMEAPPVHPQIHKALQPGVGIGTANYTLMSQLMEKLVDRYWPITEWERYLRRHGVRIPRHVALRMNMTLKRGQIAEAQEDLHRRLFVPLMEVIKNEDGELGTGRKDMGLDHAEDIAKLYSIKGRHAVGRGRVNPKIQSAAVVIAPASMTPTEATRRLNIHIARYGEEHTLAVRDAAAKISKHTREIWRKYKQVDAKTIEHIETSYPFYVPFRLHEVLSFYDDPATEEERKNQDKQARRHIDRLDTTINRMYYGQQSGLDMRVRPLQAFTGLSKEAQSNSLLLLMAQANLAVAQGFDVELGWQVLDLIKLGQEAKSSIAGGRPLNNIAVIVEREHQARLKVTKDKDGEFVDEWVFDPGFDDRDEVIVLLNREGDYVSVYFDPQYAHLALALKDQNMSAGNKSNVMAMASMGTRFIAAMITRWNPFFSVPNFIRDTTTAHSHIAAEYGYEVANEMFLRTRLLTNIRVLWKVNKMISAGTYKPESKEFLADPELVMYHRYKKAGGPVTFLDLGRLRGLEDFFNELRDYNDPPGKHQLRHWRGKVDDLRVYIENFNDAFENAARFAYFQYGAENHMDSKLVKGERMDDRELAHGAKNLTVNFEMSGSVGGALNGIYMFANANVQSTVRLLDAMFERDVTGRKTFQPYARKVIGNIIVMHAGLAVLNAAIGGVDPDDDELYWDKIPDYEKRSNLIILDFLGGSGKGLKLPLAYGYNVPAAIGSLAGEIMVGSKTIDDAVPYLIETALQAFSPVGGGSELTDMITPTLLKPVFEISRNRDWKGSAIFKDRYGDNTIPDSQLAFESVNPLLQAATTWLNEATGGNKFRAGSVLGVDTSINPATIQHLMVFAGGGISKAFFRGMDVGKKVIAGDEVELGGIPLVRRFALSPSEHAGRTLYRDRRARIIQVERMLKDGLSLNSEDRMLMKMIGARKATDRKIKKIRQNISRYELGDPIRKGLDKSERSVQNKFNKHWNSVMKREPIF